jgi:hypothetical protein
VRGPESATLGNNDAAPRGAAPRAEWGRGKSTEKDDRLRRASQLFSHSQLTQEFARQKVSTTQNKLKEADQRKSLDLFTSTCKDMAKTGELTVEKAKLFCEHTDSVQQDNLEHPSSTPQLSSHCIEGEWTPSNDGEPRQIV